MPWAALFLAWSLRAYAAEEVQGPTWVEVPVFSWPEGIDASLGPARVELELLVDEQGGIESIRVVSGPAELAEHVVRALDGRRFTPATEGGIPVAVLVPLVVELIPPAPVPEAPPPPPAPVDAGITATYTVPRGEVSRQSLSAEELRSTPGTLGDPLRAVANLPGTVRTPLDMGWLLVRGGNPEHTAVYVDGVRVPLVYHLGGFSSVVHPAYVERVDFLPGGGPSRYGRALAGTVDLVTRGQLPAAEARLGANLVFAGAFASAPVGPATLSASVRRSYIDAVAAPFLEGDAAGALPRFWDWQARADLPGGSNLFAFGYVDEIDVPEAGDTQITLRVLTQRLHGRARVPVGSRELVLTPAVAFEKLALEDADIGVVQARESVTLDARAETPDPLVGTLGWAAGLDAQVAYTRVAIAGLDHAIPVATPDVYADLRWGRSRGPHLVGGLRVDSLFAQDQPARMALSPRLSGHWPTSARSALEVELGVYHQPPSAEVLIGETEGASLELDEALGAGVGGRIGVGPVEATMDIWGRDYARLSVPEADYSTDSTHGLAYGLDLGARLRWRRLSAMLRYSYARSFRRDDPDEAWWPSPYDQPHTLGLVAAYDLSRHWTISSRFRYASGFWVGFDGAELADLLTLQTETLDPESGRVEVYHALDLKVAKNFRFRGWSLDAYLDIENVYNHRVPEPVITGISSVHVDVLGRGLPVLPIFGVEAKFPDRRDQ